MTWKWDSILESLQFNFCRRSSHMQVEAALRQGESIRWLSSNPAQQHEAPGRDPSALLHRLQLGQASAASPSGPQVRNVTIRPFTRKLDMI